MKGDHGNDALPAPNMGNVRPVAGLPGPPGPPVRIYSSFLK